MMNTDEVSSQDVLVNNYAAWCADIAARLDGLRKEFLEATQYEDETEDNRFITMMSDGQAVDMAGDYLRKLASRHVQRTKLGNAVIQTINKRAVEGIRK